MRKIVITLVFVISGLSAFSQTRITWKTLSDVEFTDQYVEEVEAYYYYPSFGPEVKALAGQEVYLQGHMLVIDPKKDIYILSKNPFAACFFCGNAGPESIVELELKPDHPRFLMDQIVTIKGILALNSDDLKQCNYILEEAGVYNP